MEGTQYPQRLSTRKVMPTRALSDIAADAAAGLLNRPRFMPPKYFYDARGSRLFDAICDTPEYYPTRTEDALLEQYAVAILEQCRPAHIIEFGSGTSRKTRRLLGACDSDLSYWPFDVCEAMLHEAGHQLVQEYDWLDVNVLVGDYLAGLDDLPEVEGPCLYLFLGGTIGNFSPRQAHDFLVELRSLMKPDDCLLLGADRLKDRAVLHAAYNDADGITAEFNLNLLRVLNRELDADFEPRHFRHRALFDDGRQRIEMYLESRRRQSVRIGALDARLELEAGERILTEISRKFSRQGLEALLQEAGFSVQAHYQPDDGWYSLLLAGPGGLS